jgi:5-oxoprolinase (ATP-hydrolysing) subunit A
MNIDINCDLGESFGEYKIGNDEAIMPYITSANIACGFHAGDPLTICTTIILAIKHNVGIGAHPGYPDLEGFGRRPMKLSDEELRASILYQVGSVKSISETLGGNLRHVKPHGALYNMASADYGTALVIASAVKEISSSLILYGMAGSEMIRAATDVGLNYAPEFFADRSYTDDGTLVPRNIGGSVIHDTNQVIKRVIKLIKENSVVTISGKTIADHADTICIHGDNKMAPEFVREITNALIANGITYKSPLKRQ